ncbi:hypothetical protein V6N13_068338 [Hibiscus sabdariffa]|uniref:Secreted protein n=1 Tax=Hibiscus sabdariffa TaxID=183260 RepID=A0ABR2QMC0_9ROSI
MWPHSAAATAACVAPFSSSNVTTAQEVVDCSKTKRFSLVFNRLVQSCRGCDVACIAGSRQRGQCGILHYIHECMHASESREKAW